PTWCATPRSLSPIPRGRWRGWFASDAAPRRRHRRLRSGSAGACDRVFDSLISGLRRSLARGERSANDVQVGGNVPREAVPLAIPGQVDHVGAVATERIFRHAVLVRIRVEVDRRRTERRIDNAWADEGQARNAIVDEAVACDH